MAGSPPMPTPRVLGAAAPPHHQTEARARVRVCVYVWSGERDPLCACVRVCVKRRVRTRGDGRGERPAASPRGLVCMWSAPDGLRSREGAVSATRVPGGWRDWHTACGRCLHGRRARGALIDDVRASSILHGSCIYACARARCDMCRARPPRPYRCLCRAAHPWLAAPRRTVHTLRPGTSDS